MYVKGRDIMCFSLEFEIAKNINKSEMNYCDSLRFIDSLYYANWEMLTEYFSDEVNKVFEFINTNTFDEKQTEGILNLYEGPLKYIN